MARYLWSSPMELLLYWDPGRLYKKVKDLAPEAEGTYCATHTYALVSKTSITALKNELD